MSTHAPWEKAFDKVVTPFEEFIHHESTSGLLLMACAILALLLANSALHHGYEHVLHTPIGFNIGDWRLEHSLHHWVNDGLMWLFFFLVGLEIKREVLVGQLSVLRQAMLPIVAAIGGMVVPALLYVFFNLGGEGINAGAYLWPPILRSRSGSWCCWAAACRRACSPSWWHWRSSTISARWP